MGGGEKAAATSIRPFHPCNDLDGPEEYGDVEPERPVGALTLAPGIYQSAGGAFAITLVDLTLDAGGNADAVWVFQTASTLVVGTGRSVILAGGAQAKNVFWHVGSAATINGGSHMVGTIIADSGVTFPGGGATLDGRALSLVSAVSFLDTTVNVPVP